MRVGRSVFDGFNNGRYSSTYYSLLVTWMIDLAAETRAKRTEHGGQNRVGLGGRDRSGRCIGECVGDTDHRVRDRESVGEREGGREKDVELNL